MTQSEQVKPAKRGIWYLADVVYRRLKLFTRWEVIGFFFSFALYLIMVYPHQDLQDRLADRVGQSDPLATEYIRAFLQADPNNQALRLALARRLMENRAFYGEVRSLLGALYAQDNVDIRNQAHWIELAMLEQELFATKRDSLDYPKALDKYRHQLLVLLGQDLDPDQLLLLGQKAQSAGIYQVALLAYRKVGATPHLPSQKYEAAAAALRGFGEYAESADLYFRAMNGTKSMGLKRKYFVEAMRTLQGGGLYKQMILASERYSSLFANDTETLIFLTRQMQAADRIDLALPFVKMLMRLDDKGVPSLPFHQEAYALAVQVFNWTNNVDLAISVANSAVKQNPKSAQWLDLLANLYDWNGRAEEGIRYRLRYARLTGSEKAWDKVLETSQQINDLEHMREALEHKVDVDAFHWLQDLMDVYERMGIPDAQITKLEELWRKTSDPKLKEKYLSKQMDIFDRRQDVESARLVAERLRKDFGLKPEYAKKLASYYARQRNFKEAFTLLQSVKDQIDLDDDDFWHDYAELGAHFQVNEAADMGLTALLEGNAKRDQDLLSLFYIWSSDRPDAAARLAAFAFFNAEVETKTKVFMKTTLLSHVDPKTGIGPVNETNFTTMLSHKSFDSVFAVAAMDLFARLEDWAAARQFIDRMDAFPAALEAGELMEAAKLYPPEIWAYRVKSYDKIRKRYADTMRKLGEDDRFLAPRASMWQKLGRLDLAQKDLVQALTHHENNMHVRAALMWVSLERHQVEPLKKMLRVWASEAEENDVLWGPFSAALMALNRPREALYWLDKSKDKMHDDYLWQMTYADCWEANSQPDVAWRIRRRAWSELRRPEVFRNMPPTRFTELRSGLAKLAPSFFDTSDGAKRILQQLLRAEVKVLQAGVRLPEEPFTGRSLVRDSVAVSEAAAKKKAASPSADSLTALFKAGSGVRPMDDVRMEATVKELALAYAQSSDAHDLSRAWMATRFANYLAKPLSTELSLCLEENDRPCMSRILDQVADLLPIADHIEAAQRVGAPALAETLAFEHLVRTPDDEHVHEQLTNLTTTDHTGLLWRNIVRQEDALSVTERSGQVGIRVSPTLTLTPGIVLRQQFSTDLVNLPNVPGQDNTAFLKLQKLTDTGFMAATLQQRQGATTHQGALFEYTGAFSRELALTTKLGVNQPALESAMLHVGGMRTGIEANITYQATQRDYARLDLDAQRYSSQAGTFLGTGRYWNVEVGHHVRLEYPDIIARAYISQAQFVDSGLFDAQIAQLVPIGTSPVGYAYLPQSSSTYGFSLGLGTKVEQKYSRAWRPFAEIGVNSNSISGAGYDLRLGAVGSVLGGDVLNVHVQTLSNKPMSQQNSREVGFQYQWFF